MTIRDGARVIAAQPRHAAALWQAPTPLAPARPAPVFTRPKTLRRSRIGSRANSRTSARSRQPLPAARPQPRNIGRPNLLSP